MVGFVKLPNHTKKTAISFELYLAITHMTSLSSFIYIIVGLGGGPKWPSPVSM